MNNCEISMDNVFNILNNLIIGNEIVYVSTPINTGERYINWYVKVGKNIKVNGNEFIEQRNRSVIQPNIENAKKCVENIRYKTSKIVIDPSTLENDILNWCQNDFYEFWDKVIKNLVQEIVFLDGWEYSLGCCIELLSAIENNVDIFSQDMRRMSIADAVLKLKKSINKYSSHNMIEGEKIKVILDKIEKISDNNISTLLKYIEEDRMKDEKLNVLISNNIANIAQYISIEPNSGLKAKFVHISGLSNKENMSTKELIKKLIETAPSKSVNIRSFSSSARKGNTLILNRKIEDIDDILSTIDTNSQMGKYSIINENISIHDGGVSGVVLGNIIEFCPDDTPKCVDKDGVCSLPRELGMKILNTVYGFSPVLKFDANFRIEFSIHPSRQGVKKEHTIIWEYEYYKKIESEAKISWPNRFSKFIGDKVFGLLIADALGLMVPKTTVVSRKIAPFSFGRETGLFEKWIRTCPITKEPGKYYSGMNWMDPFVLMNQEEAKGENDINIASLLSQDAVEAIYSGASFIRLNDKEDLIEGVKGRGDKFMLGKQNNESLPVNVIDAVRNINDQLRIFHNELGDVSIEWVFDGLNVWVVQLNQLKIEYPNNGVGSQIIVSGTPTHYEKFFVKDGLDELRSRIDYHKDKNIGIELIGNVGLTSHFGDLLRLVNIPAILSPEKTIKDRKQIK